MAQNHVPLPHSKGEKPPLSSLEGIHKAVVAWTPRALNTDRRVWAERLGRLLRIKPLFMILVILPTLLTGFYLTAFAVDQYETEVSFAVRQGNQQQRTSSGLMAFAAQISGLSGTSQETFMVMDYLQSTAIIHDIKPFLDLEKIFSQAHADYFARMSAGLPIEDQLKYWKKRVIPEVDTRSGIINVKVRTFSAQESKMLAERLLMLCEQLVNSVSLRARTTTLERVEGDVRRHADALADVRRRLQGFRDTEGSVDPLVDAEQLVKLMADLTSKKAALDIEMNALRSRLAANSPVMTARLQESQALEHEIEAVSRRLTGSRAKALSVSGKLVEYEMLKTELGFKEKMYEISLASYETARDEVLKQQIFAIPVAKPQAPESATHPRKIMIIASILMVCAAIWAVLSLLIAAIEDHLY